MTRREAQVRKLEAFMAAQSPHEVQFFYGHGNDYADDIGQRWTPEAIDAWEHAGNRTAVKIDFIDTRAQHD